MNLESETKPLVSIITVTYNGHDVSCEFLKSIKKVNYPNLEVVMVDNASEENPETKFKGIREDLVFVRSEKNLGFAGGNNLGIEVAKGKYLFFVNNDTELTEGIISRLVEACETQTNVGAVSPKIKNFHEPDVIQYAGYEKVSAITGKNKTIGCNETDHGQYDKIGPTHYAHGCGMMVPAKVIEDVGKMPEDFFLYYEELDWCEMMTRKDYRIYYQPEAVLYHKGSMSTGKESTLKTYFINRNRILFMRRNRNLFQLTLFITYFTLFALPKNVILYLLKGKRDHLNAYIRGVTWHFRKASLNEIS